MTRFALWFTCWSGFLMAGAAAWEGWARVAGLAALMGFLAAVGVVALGRHQADCPQCGGKATP